MSDVNEKEENSSIPVPMDEDKQPVITTDAVADAVTVGEQKQQLPGDSIPQVVQEDAPNPPPKTVPETQKEAGDEVKVSANEVDNTKVVAESTENAQASVESDTTEKQPDPQPQVPSGTEVVAEQPQPDEILAKSDAAVSETIVKSVETAAETKASEPEMPVAAAAPAVDTKALESEMLVETAESAVDTKASESEIVETAAPAVDTKASESDTLIEASEPSVATKASGSEILVETAEPASEPKVTGSELPVETAEPASDTKTGVTQVSEIKPDVSQGTTLTVPDATVVLHPETAEVKTESGKTGEDLKNAVNNTAEGLETKENQANMSTPVDNGKSLSKLSFLLDDDDEGSESGTEEDQAAFMKELENFFRERSMDFKPPKFYGEALNCLKLWRAVMRLGGYDKVTSCKLWRQVGESFRPPKTCTTVSWTFRGFYEKALLDYERHKVHGGEVTLPTVSPSDPGTELQGSGSGRARRDAAARAMQGWHSQRLLGNGEVSDPIIKDKTPVSLQKREKQLRNIGLLKRKKPSYVDNVARAVRTRTSKTQVDIAVVDHGPPADWVKINVQRTKDCFEVYALVPGLLREEVRVQSDPAGRLVISGEPEHPENPWGVTPFKKVVNLPSRIDPHQTSAVVTLHGQLFVRVPFEQSE